MKTTFGYGAAVPIETFVKVFPDSFVKGPPGYTLPPSYRTSEMGGGYVPLNVDRLNTPLVKFRYNKNSNDRYEFVYIVTAHSVTYEGTYVPYYMIDIDSIIKEGNMIYSWLKQNFPESDIGFMMFQSS